MHYRLLEHLGEVCIMTPCFELWYHGWMLVIRSLDPNPMNTHLS